MDIVIVHYHAAASVRDAVMALRLDASSSNIRLNILVADNGSTPDERALLQSLDIQYLNIGRNAGYAGAANISFHATRSDCIVLLNEDVIVLAGCLQELHAALMSGASVAGPQFFWDRDSVFLLPCTEERTRRNELLKVGGRRSLRKLERARKEWREHARRHWRTGERLRTTALSGALLAFRRDTFRAVGPFDDKFRLYFEENDWLLRVARAGLQSVYVPAAKAIHLHNPTLARSPERQQWEADSFLRFGSRYYGEHFVRRLLLVCKRATVIPDWQPCVDVIRLDRFEECVWPLWIEMTPSPSGFPAAATCITDPKSEWWRLPPMRGLEFLNGTFYLQIVDDVGQELGRYSYQLTGRMVVRAQKRVRLAEHLGAVHPFSHGA